MRPTTALISWGAALMASLIVALSLRYIAAPYAALTLQAPPPPRPPICAVEYCATAIPDTFGLNYYSGGGLFQQPFMASAPYWNNPHLKLYPSR